MPKGPCRTCLGCEPFNETGRGASCHADPMPMKLKDYQNWWCIRYEADPDKVKAEKAAEKAALDAAKAELKAAADAEKEKKQVEAITNE